MRPCLQAADPCTCAVLAVDDMTTWGICVPARNLKRGAKNLGAYKFRHGGWWALGCSDFLRRGGYFVGDVGGGQEGGLKSWGIRERCRGSSRTSRLLEQGRFYWVR